MRSLLWLSSVLLMLVGFFFLIVGLFTAFATDWQPTKALRSDEKARIHAASMFVEARKKETGRLPVADEFQQWAQAAPETLRMDGVGFAYSPFKSSVYEFSWWGGNAWLRWKSDTTSTQLAEISSADYFMFGSKLFDLFVFFVLGTAAIFAASRISIRVIGEK